jgi:cytochrome P450
MTADTQRSPGYPMAREDPLHPPAALGLLRGRDAITKVRLFNGEEAWLVTRHADARALLRDRRLSADATRPHFPMLFAGRQRLVRRPSFIRMDEPAHSVLRRMLTTDFMVRHIERLRPRIQEVMDELVDDVLEGTPPADLVEAVTLPLPSLVICELLGVPYGDHEFFQQRTRTLLSQTASADDLAAAADELFDYLDHLVTEQELEPGPGLVGRLILERRRTGQLDHDGLVSMVLLLLVAGHETTANMTALSVLSLIQDRPLFDALQARPERVTDAVEELLRFHTIVQTGLPRVATEDIPVGDRIIPAGDGVIVSLAAANRDGEAFDDPDALDLSRTDARRHVAFGFGIHACLGQSLARMELAVALTTMTRRMPGLRLAIPLEQVAFRHDMGIYGVHALPVLW